MQLPAIAISSLLLNLIKLEERCFQRGNIRLQNGTNKFEGRVEVCGARNMDNQTLIWKTVCNAGWDVNEAIVVCRQLGFSGNLNPVAVTDGTFSDHSLCHDHVDYTIKKNFTCKGDEEILLVCTYYNRNSTYCNELRSRMKPAGVYCFGQDLDLELKHSNDGDIRLSNGINNASGRVEIFLDGLWGTVCDDGWDSDDATTVCKQLGYNDIKRAIPTREAYFGEGSGPIHLSSVDCSSQEARLTDCTSDKTGVNGCKHKQDAGVICMGPSSCGDGEVRLVGRESEREGRVEICYNGVWGTVCADYGWDEVNADIVCQQLDFVYQQALPTNNSHFGAGEGPIILENIRCNPGHSNMSQCVDFSFGVLHSCKHTAGVICVEHITIGTSTEQVTTMLLSYDTSSARSGSYTLPLLLSLMGALIIAITVIALLIMVVVMRKILGVGQKENSDKKSSMDDPTYDCVTPTTARTISNEEDERIFQNPLYTDVGHCSSNPHHHYDHITMDTPIGTFYENVHGPGTFSNENGRAYAVSESCYSALDHRTEYSTLEPHIPKPYQEQMQPSEDHYSQLHHK